MKQKEFRIADKRLLCRIRRRYRRDRSDALYARANHQWIPPTINYQNARPQSTSTSSKSWSQRELELRDDQFFRIRWNQFMCDPGRVH